MKTQNCNTTLRQRHSSKEEGKVVQRKRRSTTDWWIICRSTDGVSGNNLQALGMRKSEKSYRGRALSDENLRHSNTALRQLSNEKYDFDMHI